MKDKFKYHLDSVLREYGITEQELFARTKRRISVDARQALFLLCRRDDLPISYIQQYFKNNGLEVSHSTIIHGTRRMRLVLAEDETMKEFFDEQLGISN